MPDEYTPEENTRWGTPAYSDLTSQANGRNDSRLSPTVSDPYAMRMHKHTLAFQHTCVRAQLVTRSLSALSLQCNTLTYSLASSPSLSLTPKAEEAGEIDVSITRGDGGGLGHAGCRLGTTRD